MFFRGMSFYMVGVKVPWEDNALCKWDELLLCYSSSGVDRAEKGGEGRSLDR